jgi:hypothetical protein
VVLAAVCGLCAGQSVTLYVAVNGSDAGNNCSLAAKPCGSLPTALNASNVLAASAVVTVQLTPGSYGANSCGGLSLHDVTVAGVGGAVDIDCGGGDRLLRVVNSSVDVRSLSVRNGRVVFSTAHCGEDNPQGGGAVSIEWGDDTPRSAVFTDVSFRNCDAVTTACDAYGGAVNAQFGSNARIAFHGCKFFNTSAVSSIGGGMTRGGAVNLRARWSSPSTTNVDVTINGSAFDSTVASSDWRSGGGAVSFAGGRNASGIRFTVIDTSFNNTSSIGTHTLLRLVT